MTASLDDFSLLVDLKAPSDLIGRPAYNPSLDATDSKLAEVLAPYHFDAPYPCGLASCRQPHQNGFLVVTVDGVETNVGQDCGKRIFGDDFDTKANIQRKRAERKYQLDTLHQVLMDKEKHLTRVAELYSRRFGTKWAEDAISRQAASKLHAMAARGETTVESVREATADEKERHRAMGTDSKPLRYITEKVGDLQGLAFLNSNPHQATTALKDKIYELERTDTSSLSPRKLKD